MKVLGIDPGSNFMGLACIESKGSALSCVGHKTIFVMKESDGSWGSRLKKIFTSVTEAIQLWQPDVVSVEEVFFAKNAQSALKLGQARGAALAAVAVLDLPIFEYSSTLVKQALTSSGRADKEQVQHMVRLLLGASLSAQGAIEKFDSSDALAIAICHAQQSYKHGILQASSQKNSWIAFARKGKIFL